MTQAEKVLKVAVSQIGYCESPAGSNRTKYGKFFGMNGVPWCSEFLYWCFQKAGAGSLYPHNASTLAQDEIVSKCHGKWIMRKNKSASVRKAYLKKAKPGDVVCFSFKASSDYRYHIGIVEKVSGDYLITLEGNTSKSGSQSNGGMVVRQRRIYTSVCSAVRPKWSDSKPDPKYTGKLPALPGRGWFQVGDKGEEVKKLQRALNWANDGRIVAKLVVDGEVGALTISAVSFFEEIQHLTIDGEFGQKCKERIANMDMNGRIRACNWAVSVAKDNRFTYGAGERAHRSGCYFCQTNTGPRMKKKERKGEPHVVKDKHGNGHTYTMTYCCNTFLTAAYAHGAKDSKTLAVCKSGSCFGMTPAEWEKSPNFKSLGKCSAVPFSKLIAGDIIMSQKSKNGWREHTWMYLGGDKYVEASGGNWAADSIAVKGKAKNNYAQYAKRAGCYVVRYTK